MTKVQKKKRVNKTKEQIKQEMQVTPEILRQRKFVKGVYQFLLEKNLTVSEARTLCQALASQLQAEFGKRMTDEQNRLSALKVTDFGDFIRSERGTEDMQALATLFAEETVSTTNSLLGGLAASIESFITIENNTRKLETVKESFL